MRMVKDSLILKSEIIKDKIKPIKLTITNSNCNNEKDKIFESNELEFLKFFIEKKIIKIEQPSPKNKE